MSAYKPLILLLLAIAFIGVVGQARAQTACEWNSDCIVWSYDDGTPSGIASHRIETAKAAAGPWTTVATVPMPAMAYKRSPVDGTNYYRIVTLYSAGPISDPSVVASSTAVPPAPTTLQVADDRAYRLELGYANQLRVSLVGKIPVGTLCTSHAATAWSPVESTTLGLNVVAYRQLAVIDAGKSRPLAVLARCKP